MLSKVRVQLFFVTLEEEVPDPEEEVVEVEMKDIDELDQKPAENIETQVEDNEVKEEPIQQQEATTRPKYLP